jgi:methyl-accepting chemotaxis protein
VNQLIADMQKHMAEQSQRTERMCGAIEQLARVMNDVPDISREQARTLASIAGQLEAADSASRELAEAVGEIPKVTRAQSEALTGISRRLDMMNEQSVVGNQAMEKLNTVVSSVGQSGQTQTDLLRQLDARASEQNQRLGELLDSQGRRFTILIVVVVLLALIAIAASILAVRLH